MKCPCCDAEMECELQEERIVDWADDPIASIQIQIYTCSFCGYTETR